MRTTALVAIVALLATVGLSGAPGTEVLKDAGYVENGHPEQELDFYWPGGKVQATVLFIHGGGLDESGERRSSPLYRDVCRPFVAAGFGCASTDYRLSPSFQWPAMPEDVAAAIQKVRELIAARGGDPDRLYLFGHSSGCQLAAVVGADPTYLRGLELSPANLAGVIAMGCTLDRNDSALRGLTAEEIREAFYRDRSEVKTYGSPENWLAANPARHIGSHVPPTLVVVAEGERFFPSILEQGARFVRLLLEAGLPAELVMVPGSHKSSIQDLGGPNDPTFSAIKAFIEDTGGAGKGSQ